MNNLWLIELDGAEYTTEEGIIRFSSVEKAHDWAHAHGLYNEGEVSFNTEDKEEN